MESSERNWCCMTPRTGLHPAETFSCRNGVPNENAADIEKEVRQSYLERLQSWSDQCRHDSRHGRAQIGAQCERKDIFQTERSNSSLPHSIGPLHVRGSEQAGGFFLLFTYQWSKRASGNGGRLSHHGISCTECNSNVPIHIGSFVYHSCESSLE